MLHKLWYWVRLSKNQEIVLFTLLIAVSASLRFYLLPGNMPFIGDQAKDYFSAVRAVETGEIPLLGIESSLPQFRQGPLYIWSLAILFKLFGFAVENTAYFAASVSVASVGLLYIFMRHVFGRKAAFYAAAILGTSPLAIAHGQFAFMVNPIPLFSLLYITALYRYIKVPSVNVFWPALTFGLLFQFELSHAPLIILLPVVVWMKQGSLLAQAKPALKGLIVGVLPQLAYDVTHGFSQLGLFAAWVAYRIAGFFGYKDIHQFSWEKITNLAQTYHEYWYKFAGWGSPLIFWLLSGIMIIGLLQWLTLSSKRFYKITLVWLYLFIITGGYLVHGAPSEAYFPVYFIPVSLIIGYTLARVNKPIGQLLALGLILVVMIHGAYVFVQSRGISARMAGSLYRTQAWLPRLETQQTAIHIMVSPNKAPIHLRAMGPAAQFPAYLDNYRYLLWLEEAQLSSEGRDVWIITSEDRLNPPLVNHKIYYFDHFTLAVEL